MNIEFEVISAFILMAIFMLLLWTYHLSRGEADVVDAGWAAGLGMVAVFYSLNLEGDGVRRIILAVLAALWAGRLSSYILFKRVFTKGEDGRYSFLRARWGSRANLNFFWFFQAQGFLVVVLSASFFIVAVNKAPFLSGWDYAGIGVFVVSLAGEALADRQLSRFKSDPANRGKTCREGLWRYSRHPNYFFEWLHWWSYVFLSVGSEYFLLSLLSPAIMLYLILKVTGIPPAEKQALLSRGDDYREYQRTTSPFIPWFPKS